VFDIVFTKVALRPNGTYGNSRHLPALKRRAIFHGSSGTESHHTQFIRNHEGDLRGSGHQIQRDARDLKSGRSLTATDLEYLLAED